MYRYSMEVYIKSAGKDLRLTFIIIIIIIFHQKIGAQDAASYIKKAIAINPGHINHHLELVITYETLGKKDLAVSEYKKILELPKKDADDDRYKKKRANDCQS